jgi:hypothetical protein
MAAIGDVFRPGEKVPHSGIYKVMHDRQHATTHEVTCVFGKVFPTCSSCGKDARFKLVRKAQHVEVNLYFKSFGRPL